MSIKKFESFNLRKPTLINYAISKEKIETIGTESFSEKEIEFFQKIKEENKTAIYDIDFWSSGDFGTNIIFLSLYPSGEDDNLLEFEIQKLKDEWYIIRYVNNDDPSGEDDNLLEFEIQKLKDEWYIIRYVNNDDYYLCDEFEEVKGFLGTETILRF